MQKMATVRVTEKFPICPVLLLGMQKVLQDVFWVRNVLIFGYFDHFDKKGPGGASVTTL
jgi:hypothetical protein